MSGHVKYDLSSRVSEAREALRQLREARKAFETDMDDILLRAKWKLAEHDYTEAKRKLDDAVHEAIGLFQEPGGR